MADIVIRHIQDSFNCSVQAVPGAGKSRLLRQLARQVKTSIILAYNSDLAQDYLTDPIDGCSVYTFHGLCSKFLGLARDDEQMVAQVQSGTLMQELPDVDLVLIDEGQDVRRDYVNLLVRLGLQKKQICIVGDARQLVYDFDVDFPATLDTLTRSSFVFSGCWKVVQMNESYRINRHMAAYVNHMFGSSIVAHKDGPPVEIRVAKTMFKLYPLLEDVLTAKQDVLLLVNYKANNRPLIALINECSRNMLDVTVHGTDDRRGRIHCGTFWSCKGLESENVIVLLPECEKTNPTYVALTRALTRLIVVIDMREPHIATCKTAEMLPEHFNLYDERTSSTIDLVSGCSGEFNQSFRAKEWSTGGMKKYFLDKHIPERKLMTQVRVEDHEGSNAVDSVETLSNSHRNVLVRMALIQSEVQNTGSVRYIHDIRSPTRLDGIESEIAIKKGLVSRYVNRAVSQHSLLAEDLTTMAIAAYTSYTPNDLTKLVLMALACEAWDSFDHIMRVKLPVCEKDFEPFVERIAWVCNILNKDGIRFDVRLCSNTKDLHCRVHATANDCCYHVVWDVTNSDIGHATVRAGLHPRRNCCVLIMSTMKTKRVSGLVDFP